jgi:hypothetical protein
MKMIFLSFLLVSCAHNRNLVLYEIDQNKVKECQIVESENYGKWPKWENKVLLVEGCK